MSDRPSLKLILFRHKTLSTGLHPVVVQLIHQGRVKRYSSGYSCRFTRDAKKAEWDAHAQRFTSRFEGYKSKNAVLTKLLSNIGDILDEMQRSDEPFTFEKFNRRYRHTGGSQDFVTYMQERIEAKRASGKIGSAQAYRGALLAITRFSGGRIIRFTDLTPHFFDDLEKNLRANGCTGGGIAAYMRSIRAVVNSAIREDKLHPDLYPFKHHQNARGYSISQLKSGHNPRSLSDDQMVRVKEFRFEAHPHLARAVIWFLFIYYSRGMNFIDMAYLKNSDVTGGRIRYTRRKTGDMFSIPIGEALAKLLEPFRGQDATYVFPILTKKHRTPQQQKDRIKKVLKKLNEELKEVSKILSLDVPLTSYVARHTFATTLKRRGVDVAVISESMGHENSATTAAYLKRFENDVLDAADKLL